ncbi:MAG: sulfatase-like hydrolase/transferase [Phycisphaera sp.]|nr:sulfatase-like hydrolase/transferase [Phycisphaera sp.]
MVVCLISSAAARAADPRPNIIFIFSDDQAYQAIGAYGYPVGKIAPTPNFDRIAKDGMLFRECYVTNSLCGPMRAVIQTGKYSHINGFVRNGNKFNGDQQTFPKLLQAAGYQTAVIGKWHLGEHQAPQGYNYSEVLVGQGPYYNPPMLRDATGTGDIKQVEKIKHEGYTTEIIGDLTLKWLKEGRDPNKPFMLMAQHKAPHRNWQPAPKYLHLFDDVTIPEPPTLFDDYAGRPDAVKNQDMMIKKTMNAADLKLTAPGNLTPEQRATWDAAYNPKNEAFKKANLEGDDLIRWKYQRYMKDYLRCVRSVDDEIGRLLDYLDESGLAKNTVVIYCSDQGFYLGEHGWFDKRWIYEESLRTPLMVRWPGVVKPGSENHDIVSSLDLAETFLDIAGVKVPDDMQGKSLVPILKGKTPEDWRKSFYYHYYEFPGAHSVHKHEGVVDGRYKLIHFYTDDQWELIDLKENPLETKNFIDDPAHADVKARLMSELDRLRDQLKVTDEDPEGTGGPKKNKKK